MSAQHTPGPWFVTSENGGSKGCTVWARGGDVAVAVCNSPNISLPGRQHDARLIAAAPELLEALTALLHAFPGDYEVPPLHIVNAHAAIAKAHV